MKPFYSKIFVKYIFPKESENKYYRLIIKILVDKLCYTKLLGKNKMSQPEDPLEINYTAQEYLETHDSLSGAKMTLEQAVDRYINTLGEFLAGGSVSQAQLDNSIRRTVDSLERVYDSLDSMDKLLENENLVARIQTDNSRRVFDLEESLETMSGGIYNEIGSFEDLTTFFGYTKYKDLEADQKHLKSGEEEVEAPTKIISDEENLLQLDEELDTQYRRIIYSEILARRHIDDETNFMPPISRMLNNQEHSERAQKLDNQIEKNS